MQEDASELTRRAVLAAAAAQALVAGTARAQDAARASGSVYEDIGAHGPGLPDVMVSNGRDVVRTDADGRWHLPVRAGDTLFVIKPPGFATPIDPATQLPRFAYNFLPEGTPPLGQRFAGLAPTGPLPDSVDFPLRRQEESPQFDVLLFTDPQPESLAEVGYVRDDVVATVAGVPAAFGITHGDLMFDDLSFYGRYNAIVGSVGRPWYNCCGNHDMNLEAPDNTHSRDTFKRTFGARYHAFQYAAATFLILDNVEYLGTDPTKPNGSGKYRGRFGADQLGFVRNVLANVPRDSLVVLSFHIPLRTLAGTEPNTANTDTAAFLEAISTHPNSVSFSGHTHTNEHWYFGADEGFGGGTHHHHVLAAVSGSWWSGPLDERGIPIALQTDGTPNGHHILSVDAGRYVTTLVPARDPVRGQLRIMLDSQVHRADPEVLHEYAVGALLTGPIAQAAAASTRLVVNLFDGGPRSTVTMRIGPAGPFVPMRRTVRRDPHVDEVYARNAATKKPWVRSAASTHIWQAGLPGDLAPGTHRVEVQARDEFGRLHAASMILEVAG